MLKELNKLLINLISISSQTTETHLVVMKLALKNQLKIWQTNQQYADGSRHDLEKKYVLNTNCSLYSMSVS